MYEVDDLDRVVPLPDALPSDVGSPMPALAATEDRLELAYVTQARASGVEGIAVATFITPYAHTLGPPNDEVFDGHPLAERGLERYGAFRVEESSWIRRLERMNSVHPCHSAERFRY